MKSGQVALAVTGGYFLGRFHKMRWALALASAVAGKRLRSHAGRMGSDVLQSSPELSQLAADIRADVLSAGRTAAVAAAGNRINALSDKMQDRADALRAGAGDGDGDEGPSDEQEQSEEKGSGRERRDGRREERRDDKRDDRRDGSRSRDERSSRAAKTTRDRPSSKAGATRQTPRSARDSGARRGGSRAPGASGRSNKSAARVGTSKRRRG
jgi:hypothetical protein